MKTNTRTETGFGTIRKSITICGIEDIAVEADFEARYVDHGIGAYECHGFRGVDVNYGWEINEVKNLRLGKGWQDDMRVDFERNAEPGTPFAKLLPEIRAKRREIRRAIKAMDPNEVFTEEELIARAEELAKKASKERDWPEPQGDY